ncbi:uncharacterized protein LOC129306705 [Prosopis cineraria]|uniref:uncharacterized protein LOC129306705 n=1 Tax=Prosopis cineraria TaxID=364024 RepID=UPI00240F57B3|nr:uncharacterized protein LOC129306705 [Prosopis cineraria]
MGRENWEKLIQATLKREQLRTAGQDRGTKTPNSQSTASCKGIPHCLLIRRWGSRVSYWSENQVIRCFARKPVTTQLIPALGVITIFRSFIWVIWFHLCLQRK